MSVEYRLLCGLFCFAERFGKMSFRFRKIDLNDSVEFRRDDMIGIDLYFDPMDLDLNSIGRLRTIYKDCFGSNFVDSQFKRVGKLYSFSISGNVPVDESKFEYFKRIYMMAENESLSILNVKSDDIIVKFVANVVVQISEVKR